MNEFALTAAQETLKAEARAFAERNLGADLAARDAVGAEGEDGWRADWEALADYGIFKALNAPDDGGAGQDILSVVARLEGLGEGSADNGLLLNIAAQLFAIQEPLRSFGRAAQRAAYLPGLGDGSRIGAYALTEPVSGSEAMALQTTAEKRDGGYVLNGEKCLIGMAPVADVIVVFASTAPAHKHWGISVFVVEGEDKGLVRLPADEKLGLRTMPLGGLRFEDCWIPEDRLIGKEGAGQSIFQHSMLWERCLILAGHVGAMARQLRVTTDFAKTRDVFGKAIIGHQSVANRLADMALRLETSRLMQYRAAAAMEAGTATASLAAMTNLHISEAFLASSLDAVRIHGGKGFLTGQGPEMDLRDSVGGVIYSGTSDIQRQIIASML